MIVAISGNLGSGKESFASFLKAEFNFEVHNLIDRFSSLLDPSISSSPLKKLEAFYDPLNRKRVIDV